MIVVDASLTIAAFAQEQDTGKAQAVMAEAVRQGVWVPSLWKLEVANVLRVMVTRKRAEQAFPDQILAALADMPINIDPETADRAWRETLILSREQDLTPYDAAYLELSLRLGAALGTLDIELADAARRVGVEVLPR